MCYILNSTCYICCIFQLLYSHFPVYVLYSISYFLYSILYDLNSVCYIQYCILYLLYSILYIYILYICYVLDSSQGWRNKTLTVNKRSDALLFSIGNPIAK